MDNLSDLHVLLAVVIFSSVLAGFCMGVFIGAVFLKPKPSAEYDDPDPGERKAA